MKEAAGRALVARWSPTGNSEEARAYVESRLALFALLMFWIFWFLVALLFGMYELWPDVRPQRVGFVFRCALLGQVAFAAIWYFALRRRRLSIEWLYRFDAFCLIVIGLELGNAAYQQSELPAAVYSSMIWLDFAILARTLIVPSSGTRTAVVTGVASVPLVVVAVLLGVYREPDLDVPPGALVIGTVVYSSVAVALAATGSSVIYGLKRQVSEARQLGQYTLEEKIGVGAMGTVYRGRHAMLRRPVAIKRLAPERSDRRQFKRFEREVQHMSRLTHPNTVAIYDYGRSVDGVFYYVMEYLDGIDLEELVRADGPQPAARVVRILAQVCGALTEAHGLGLTHRDVKPGNLILCRRGGRPDIAMVVDFGLVKDIAPSEDDSRVDAIAGTPAYISPEAVTDPARVGPASDIYSLGATAYFLLTGTKVFEGVTDIHRCAQHVTAVPDRPSKRTDNPIPPELEELILRCLAKDPAARPTAAALRLALRALPAYREWDDGLAEAWWEAFEADRGAQTHRRLTAPMTITRELSERTDSDLGFDTARGTDRDDRDADDAIDEARRRRVSRG
jgi:serine/threonine-protein kinase